MGLFRKRHGGIQLSLLELCGDGYCAVVGESHYQGTLRKTAAMCTRGGEGRPSFQAVLVREPTNVYDSNAIAVYSSQGKIGYLSREHAIDYLGVLAETKRQGADGGACIGLLNGGQPGKPSYGVTLRLAHPDVCLRELRGERRPRPLPRAKEVAPEAQ